MEASFVLVCWFSHFYTGLPVPSPLLLPPVIFLSNKSDHLTCLLKNFCCFPVEQVVKSKANLATRAFTGPSWLSSWAVHPHTCQVEHSDCYAFAHIVDSLCLCVLPPSSSSPAQLHLSWVWEVTSLVKSSVTNSLPQAATHVLSTLTASSDLWNSI